MSGWQDDDAVTITYRTLRQALAEAAAAEQERIIRLLHEKAAVNWIEALEYPYYAEQLEELIKGKN